MEREDQMFGKIVARPGVKDLQDQGNAKRGNGLHQLEVATPASIQLFDQPPAPANCVFSVSLCNNYAVKTPAGSKLRKIRTS